MDNATPYSLFYPGGDNRPIKAPQWGANVVICNPHRQGEVINGIFVGYDQFDHARRVIPLDQHGNITKRTPALVISDGKMVVNWKWIVRSNNINYDQRFDWLRNVAKRIPSLHSNLQAIQKGELLLVNNLKLAELYGPNEPTQRNIKEAKQTQLCTLSYKKEVANFVEQFVFIPVDKVPDGCMIIPLEWRFALRHGNDAKSRLVALGNLEPDEVSRTSPVIQIQSVRLLLLKAATNRWEVYAVYVKCALHLVEWMWFIHSETVEKQAKTIVYCDSQIAIKMLSRVENYNEIIDANLHQTIEYINGTMANETVTLQFIKGKDNRTDILTKVFNYSNFGAALKVTQPRLIKEYERVWKSNDRKDAEA